MSKLKATTPEQMILIGHAASEGILPKVENQVEFFRDLLEAKKTEGDEAAAAFIVALGFFAIELQQ